MNIGWMVAQDSQNWIQSERNIKSHLSGRRCEAKIVSAESTLELAGHNPSACKSHLQYNIITVKSYHYDKISA